MTVPGSEEGTSSATGQLPEPGLCDVSKQPSSVKAGEGYMPSNGNSGQSGASEEEFGEPYWKLYPPVTQHYIPPLVCHCGII